MLVRIKDIFSRHKIVMGNIVSLWILQWVGYVFPLIVLPYVLPIIWVENFGKISFALAFVAFFTLIVNYGFNLTATKDISKNRHDKNIYSSIFHSVLYAKIVLFLVSAVFYYTIIFLFSFENILLYHIVFLWVFAEVLFPVWMFQWMEKMKYITVINVIVKILMLGAIFLTIHERSDYLWYPIIFSAGSFLSGCIGYIFAIKIFQIRFELPSKKVCTVLREGWPIFISGIFSSLYTSAIPFFLGLVSSPVIVGYYSAADKIIKAVQSLISPITQSVYPVIATKLEKWPAETLRYISKVTGGILIFTGLASLILFLFSKPIVLLLLGSEYEPSETILQILSPLPVIIGLAIVFGHFVMIHFGYQKALQKLYVVFSLLSLTYTFPLMMFYGGIGAAISVVVTEFLITFFMYGFLRKNKIIIF